MDIINFSKIAAPKFEFGCGFYFCVIGAVSFNLKSLKITSETKGIKVKINSAKNGEKEVSFDLKETPSQVGLSQMDFSQMEIK